VSKLETCFDDGMLKAAIFTGLVAALLGVIYSCYRWPGEVRDTSIAAWRRVTSSLGLIAVTAQVLFLIPIYWDTGRYTVLFDRILPRWWLDGVILFFLSAVLCILTGRSSSKWWLVASSVGLFAFCVLALMET
jgi:hypothetical protein